MAAVNVTSVRTNNSLEPFSNPFAFEIEYECLCSLKEDLEWKVIYVGSAESEKYDQELESVLVGPICAGTFKFTLESNCPDSSKIPPDDAIGVTVILLTCSYKSKEFIRIGYYVNTEYISEELNENPPSVPQFDKVQRSILADSPRVTRFPCDFDDAPVIAEGQDVDMDAADDGMQYEEPVMHAEGLQPQEGSLQMDTEQPVSPIQ